MSWKEPAIPILDGLHLNLFYVRGKKILSLVPPPHPVMWSQTYFSLIGYFGNEKTRILRLSTLLDITKLIRDGDF